jgi:hypothetical protein
MDGFVVELRKKFNLITDFAESVKSLESRGRKRDIAKEQQESSKSLARV